MAAVERVDIAVARVAQAVRILLWSRGWRGDSSRLALLIVVEGLVCADSNID